MSPVARVRLANALKLMVLGLLLVVGSSPASAQKKTDIPSKQEGKSNKKTTAPKSAEVPPKPAGGNQPGPSIPAPERLLILIRTTLLTLNDALQTGNYTVLRDIGTPGFRAQNSATRLGLVFLDLQKRGLDLSPIAIVTPQLSGTPSITQNGTLNLSGIFPTSPLEIHFQILFQPVGGRWRLQDLAVSARPSAKSAPNAP